MDCDDLYNQTKISGNRALSTKVYVSKSKQDNISKNDWINSVHVTRDFKYRTDYQSIPNQTQAYLVRTTPIQRAGT